MTTKAKDWREKYIGMPQQLYVFVRKEGFYTIRLYDDDDARHNAKINPGTLRVEDQQGNVVWSLQ